jgi:hypothetical protein
LARAAKSLVLGNLSDIHRYFRSNQTPITAVGPSPFPLLGLSRRVAGFTHVNAIDCFDGSHPHIVVSAAEGARQAQSTQAITNDLLKSRAVRTHLAEQGPGLLLPAACDEETEALAGEVGQKIAATPRQTVAALESPMALPKLAAEAGVKCWPAAIGKAATYEALQALAKTARLGPDLWLRWQDGEGRWHAADVGSENHWNKLAGAVSSARVLVSRPHPAISLSIEAVATAFGTVVGPLQTPITGSAAGAPWCGSVASPLAFGEQRPLLHRLVQKLGAALLAKGHKGAFTAHFHVDRATGQPLLLSLTLRLSGLAALSSLITTHYGGVPLHYFHLAAHLPLKGEIDAGKLHQAWAGHDAWSVLLVPFAHEHTEMITRAPASGLYRWPGDGPPTRSEAGHDPALIASAEEAFFLRLKGAGDYRYPGGELGVLYLRGSAATATGQVSDRAAAWVSALAGLYTGIAVSGSSAPVALPLAARDVTFF